MIQSMNRANSSGDRMHPCLTPVITVNQSPTEPIHLTELSAFIQVFDDGDDAFRYTIFFSESSRVMVDERSQTFLKSMKFIITGLFHAVTFSIICRRVNRLSGRMTDCLII